MRKKCCLTFWKTYIIDISAIEEVTFLWYLCKRGGRKCFNLVYIYILAISLHVFYCIVKKKYLTFCKQVFWNMERRHFRKISDCRYLYTSTYIYVFLSVCFLASLSVCPSVYFVILKTKQLEIMQQLYSNRLTFGLGILVNC